MKNDINQELLAQIKEVVEYEISRRKSVMTFTELEFSLGRKRIDFRLPYDKDHVCFISLTPVLMAWCGWKNEVMFALKELNQEGKIILEEVSPLLYLYDGMPKDLGTIPMATNGPDYAYSSPHWIPLGISKNNKEQE